MASICVKSFCFRSMLSGADSITRSTCSIVRSKAVEASGRPTASRTSVISARAAFRQDAQLSASAFESLRGMSFAAAQDRRAHSAQAQRSRNARSHHPGADDGSGAKSGFRHAVIVAEARTWVLSTIWIGIPGQYGPLGCADRAKHALNAGPICSLRQIRTPAPGRPGCRVGSAQS